METAARYDEIVRVVRDHWRRCGSGPSQREILTATGLSSLCLVNRAVHDLIEAGVLGMQKGQARSLRVMSDRRRDFVSVPLVGKIAAGRPISVADRPFGEEQVWVSGEVVGRHQDVYALLVDGYSMVDSLINHNDIVIMKAVNTAENGDMVAVWLKGEEATTLKHIYFEGDQVRLQPANPTMQAWRVPIDDVEIQGRVLGVERRPVFFG